MIIEPIKWLTAANTLPVGVLTKAGTGSAPDEALASSCGRHGNDHHRGAR